MPELNADIPEFECYLRREFLYDQKEHQGEFERCVVFGIASNPGRAIGFHVITESGAVVWRLPIHALAHRQDAETLSLETLELWDCFSENVTVTEFDFLSETKVKTWLRDGKGYDGTYLFTLDWFGSSSADNPGDIGHKCAHVIKLDNGCFAAQPNNRIQWFEQAFVTKPFKERPDYKTNTKIFKVENGMKWQTSDDDKMFYEVLKNGIINKRTTKKSNRRFKEKINPT